MPRQARDLRQADATGRLDVLAAQALEQFVGQQSNPLFGMALNAIRPQLHRELHRNLGPRALPDINRVLKEAQTQSAKQGPTPPPPPKKERFESRADALRVLGLGPDATRAQIIAAYRETAKQYHPDKVAGLAPAFQKLADEKMKEANAAYAFLKGGPK